MNEIVPASESVAGDRAEAVAGEQDASAPQTLQEQASRQETGRAIPATATAGCRT